MYNLKLMSSQSHPEPICKSGKRQSEVQGENEELSNAGREIPQERQQQLPLGEPGMGGGSVSLCDPGDQ